MLPMVESAQQRHVVEVSGPTLSPWDDVMGLAPARWPVARRERTAAIPGGQRKSLSGGREPPGAAEVQHYPATVEHRRKDFRVGGHPQRLWHADKTSTAGGSQSGLSLQLFNREGDQHGG